MLFILTGDIQIGKTRWLAGLIHGLYFLGVTPYGVIAPGVWITESTDSSAAFTADKTIHTYEKIGIENVLIPEDIRVSFARRKDLAIAEGFYDPQSQSAQAKLAWEISESALCRVNAHFSDIMKAAECSRIEMPSLLVVDELGSLELKMGKGLSAALELLSADCRCVFSHAIVVVRKQLITCALDHFSSVWGSDIKVISPDKSNLSAFLSLYK